MVTRKELCKVSYLAADTIGDRLAVLMPLWDGARWRQWVENGDGSLVEITILDVVQSYYIGERAAAEGDLYIPVTDFLWQRASWPEVHRQIDALCDDFRNLAVCAAKLRHFAAARLEIGEPASSFVVTEIEYLLVLSRTVFDLVQEIIATLWNGRIHLIHEQDDALKRSVRLPASFRKLVLRGEQLRPAEELTRQYALPPLLAHEYARHAPFFLSLRRARDKVVHGTGRVPTIFATEKGFCVDPQRGAFALFDIWKDQHRYNENIVSLLPWVAHVVFNTIDVCSALIEAFAGQVRFPEELAPGHRVFIRDDANHALIELRRIYHGEAIWWGDAFPAKQDC